ncbi:MAG TPA: glycoside hydrolase family 78 protein [Anaerolineales bacterium]|nr:glycoside hydrolase family 78 protein [Anaerolineales bacterium]
MTIITHLRTETLEHPIGIDFVPPRLSWQMQSPRQGAKQIAYQVVGRIVEDPAGGGGNSPHWDSGRVESNQSTHIPYGGALHSRDRITWTVRVWDGTGAMIESAPAFFEMGLLHPSDWQAKWIEGTLAGGPYTSVPCPYLRKEFTISSSVSAEDIRASDSQSVEKSVHPLTARLYITALGLYEASLNGQRVGADLFNPGWTDYNQRIHYHTYDVTSLLKPGANAIGVILGDGWYCGHVAWLGRQRYGDRPKLLAQLEITYADGSLQTIVSDETWVHNYGALLSSDMLMGEAYDARRETLGWDTAGFDEARWSLVRIAESPKAKLSAACVTPVRATQEIHPISLTRVDEWPNSRWVFDLGQNMVGHVRLKVRSKSGQTLTIRHAEALVENAPLNPDGLLYTIALRAAKATDHYTCAGEGEEVWEPRFTFHGFRYVEVKGCDDTPPLDMVTGIVVHSDLPFTGRFECSEPLLNRLQQNIQWSQRGNFVSIPTDCPQRDERLGWTGDIQAFAPAAIFNMDVSAFLADWLRELALSQWDDGAIPKVAPDPIIGTEDGGPAWADALLIVPWALYQAYGDKSILAELYPAFEKFIAWLVAHSPACIRAAQGWQGHGDWLSFAETPKHLIGTAYFAHSVDLMSRIAEVLDKKDDAAKYRTLFEQIRSAFQQRFILPGGLLLSNTQTAYALALQFNLLPDDMRAAAAENLSRAVRDNQDRLTTGFVGTPYLLFALSENGHLDTAYDLLLQKDFPSWLYPVTQGATTIWERWDGWRHDRGFQSWSMNSFNHYAYGAVGNWMYQVVAGIRPDPEHPGFQNFILAPQPGGGLTHARAEYDSAYGKIISDWKIEGDEFIWKFTIPANTSADVVTQDAVLRFEAGEYEIKTKAK